MKKKSVLIKLKTRVSTRTALLIALGMIIIGGAAYAGVASFGKPSVNTSFDKYDVNKNGIINQEDADLISKSVGASRNGSGAFYSLINSINRSSNKVPAYSAILDLDSNGIINNIDVKLITDYIATNSMAKYDVNKNGVVNQEDADLVSKSIGAFNSKIGSGVFYSFFNRSSKAPAYSAVLDLDSNGIINNIDVRLITDYIVAHKNTASGCDKICTQAMVKCPDGSSASRDSCNDCVAKCPASASSILYSFQGADSKKTITITAGDKIAITLQNPGDSGGQFDNPSYDSTMLGLIEHKHTPPADTMMVGDFGTDTWTFSSLKLGATKLSISSFRPWQKAESMRVDFEMNVNILSTCVAEGGPVGFYPNAPKCCSDLVSYTPQGAAGGGTCQKPGYAPTMTEAQARVIAEKSCLKSGETLQAVPGSYDKDWKTWSFGVNFNLAVREIPKGCYEGPCGVNETTKTAQIEWRCTGAILLPACTDSDGGTKYNIAGSVKGIDSSGNAYTYSDVCELDSLGSGKTVLKEVYCDGTQPKSASPYTCPYGCKDGACVELKAY